MTAKSKAAALADELDAGENFFAESSLWYDRELAESVGEAADELRRLEAENANLHRSINSYRELLSVEESISFRKDMQRYANIANAREVLLKQALQALKQIAKAMPFPAGKQTIEAIEQHLGETE